MTVTAKPLFEAVQAAAAETTVYTTPSGTRTIIDKLTGTNTTGAVASLTVKLIPNAGSPGVSNTIVQSKTLQPSEAYTFPEVVGHVLASGSVISLLASAGASITVRASGREVS